MELYLKMDVLYGAMIGHMEYYFLMEHLLIILNDMGWMLMKVIP